MVPIPAGHFALNMSIRRRRKPPEPWDATNLDSINNLLPGSGMESPTAGTNPKISSRHHLSPAQAITAIEERPDTINNGMPGMQWDGDEVTPNAWSVRHSHRRSHKGPATMAFAKGRAESSPRRNPSR